MPHMGQFYMMNVFGNRTSRIDGAATHFRLYESTDIPWFDFKRSFC